MLLGGYNLSTKNESDILRIGVIVANLHPQWKMYGNKYDADLAILVLGKNIKFTNYIQPICLPTNNITDGTTGTIMGYDLTDNGTKPHLEFPRHAVMNVSNSVYCLTTDLSPTRTFCSNGGDGNLNLNERDAGGGFFMRSGSTWVQYGILSTVDVNATGHGDTNPIAVYTNVSMFTNWIKEYAVHEKEINLQCDFTFPEFSTQRSVVCGLMKNFI